MTYSWRFYTGGQTLNPTGRVCHRGPMIDVERVMSQPFRYMAPYETLRVRLLENIVNTDLVAVQTRETVLRTINSSLCPIFARLYSQKDALQTLICEKRNATDIESDLSALAPFYASAARGLVDYPVPQQQVDLLLAALESASPLLRVAGKSAVILLAAYIEMDLG